MLPNTIKGTKCETSVKFVGFVLSVEAALLSSKNCVSVKVQNGECFSTCFRKTKVAVL